MSPIDLLLEILSSYPGFRLRDIPARGEEGGWWLGAGVLVGALVLAVMQALGKLA